MVRPPRRRAVASATLARIDSELEKSLAVVRKKLAPLSSMRAKDDVNRYMIAANDLGRLNLQTEELAKAIQGVARNIRTAAASCNPTSIPPLFAEASAGQNNVAGITRPPPPPRSRPATAAPKPAMIFQRF